MAFAHSRLDFSHLSSKGHLTGAGRRRKIGLDATIHRPLESPDMTTAQIPETMTGIEISEPGDPHVLRPAQVPTPRPGRGEVVIRVAAAGVNRPDVVQRQGYYPPPKGASPLPGLEGAGTVVALGEDVDPSIMGAAVTALLTGGGYAQYAVAPAALCLPVPDGLDMVEAAALPETFFTVWSNLFDRAGLKPGETLLVHGGTGGIGTTAIQLAAAFGAKVFATAGSGEKCETCVRLGAARGINYREEDFVEVVKRETANGADVILDMVGGDYVQRNIRAAAADGRIVCIAFLAGS